MIERSWAGRLPSGQRRCTISVSARVTGAKLVVSLTAIDSFGLRFVPSWPDADHSRSCVRSSEITSRKPGPLISSVSGSSIGII
jgi:hypothetical protein